MIDGCAPASSSEVDSDVKGGGNAQGRAVPTSSGGRRLERDQGVGSVSSRGGEGARRLAGEGSELEAVYQAFELPGNIGQAT